MRDETRLPLSISFVLPVLHASDMGAYLPAHSRVGSIVWPVEIDELEGRLVAFVAVRVGHCRWNSSGRWHTLPYVYCVTDDMGDNVVALYDIAIAASRFV